MAEIELFTMKFTPFGQRVTIALTEKKIPFKVTTVDFTNKSDAFLEANPIHKKVPVIIHKGKTVVESLVILEYLEDAFPEHVPFMPKDAFEKSQVRFWADYINKAVTPIHANFRMKPGTFKPQEAREAVISSLKTLESGMTSYSAEGPFFTGDKFGFLDVLLAPHSNFIEIFETLGGAVAPGPDELPRFHKWIETVRAYPTVSSIVPPRHETLAYLKKRFPAWAAETQN